MKIKNLYGAAIMLCAFLTGCGVDETEFDGLLDTVQETVPDIQPVDTVEDTPVDNPTIDMPVDQPVEVVEEIPEEEIPALPEYPPPPYGVRPGDTIQNLTFNTIDGTTVSMYDYYIDESRELLLLFSTAGWCEVCHYESRALPVYYLDYYYDGFAILGAPFQDDYMRPVTADYCASYARSYGWQFQTAVDSSFQLGAYYSEESTPMNIFVDLTSMRIIDVQPGFDYVYDSMRDDIEYFLSIISR